MFPIIKCIAVKREVWYTRQGMLLIKIRSCRRCITCSNRLGTPKPSVGQDSDMEWLLSSEARIWKSWKTDYQSFCSDLHLKKFVYIYIKYCDPKKIAIRRFLKTFKLDAPEIEFRAIKKKPGREAWWMKRRSLVGKPGERKSTKK